MAFDFSKYIGQAPAAAPTPSVAQYASGYTQGSNEGLDPALASQLFNYVGRNESDANLQGEDTKQKLIDAGLIKSITYSGGEGGEDQQFYALGDKAPSNFQGNISHTDHTPEAQRIIGADSGVAKAQGLVNPNATYKDPTWGNVTTSSNLNRKDPGWDTFWKVAPMLPGLFAMGAPMLFGGLAGAGGATAGGLIGNQTVSEIGGGAIAQGGSATAGNLLSSLPSGITSRFADLVKNSISSLNSKKGFNPVSAALGLAGGIPGVGQFTPAVQAAMNLAGGGGFDFTKYIPMGLQQIAKGL